MKRAFMFILVVSWTFCFGQKTIKPDSIKWETGLSWEEIQSKAKAENKLIFIDCYATWCVPCKKMDKLVYSNDTVGKFFNENFISVRIQMDSTSSDDSRTKSWFRIARELENNYKISGFPTLLFFASEGLLLGKELGFRNVNELLNIAKLIPDRSHMYEQLGNYKKGIKDYLIMGKLVDFVAKVIGDKQLSLQIASDFKGSYLDKLDLSKLCTPENLQFALAYNQLVNSSDHFFRLFCSQPRTVDSILKYESISKMIVNSVITREELTQKLTRNGKAILNGDPNWEELKFTIKNKYSETDVEKLVLDFQVDYYQEYDFNWKKWAFYKDIRIKKYPPDPDPAKWVEFTEELNDGGAWYTFRKCNDKQVLERALEWINLALKLTKYEHPYAYLDTKANVLYKLGRVDEAIATQSLAVKEILKEGRPNASEAAKDYQKIIHQMQLGEPTYVNQGAIWDANTLPKKKVEKVSGKIISLKPTIDTSVLNKWPSVETPTLSNDGNFAMFMMNNIPAGGKTLIIRSLKTQWKQEIVGGGKNASFTEDSGKAIVLNANDTLTIINLTTHQVRYIPEISSFRLSKGNEQWMAWQVKESKGLLVENLSNGVQWTFDSVIGYYFSPGGQVLLLKRERQKSIQTILQDITWIDLSSRDAQNIWEGFHADNFIFNRSDSQLVFIVSEPLLTWKREKNNSIWYYKVGSAKAILLVDNNSHGEDTNLIIDRISQEGFSNDGSLLFIRFRGKENPISNQFDVKADVWSYFDPKLQSQQISESVNSNYLAVFDVRQKKFITGFLGDEYRVQLGKRTNGTGLVTYLKGESSEWNWNITSRPIYHILNLKTGDKTHLFTGISNFLFARDMSISPEENYIICTDQDRRNIYIYELKTEVLRNISKSIVVPETNKEFDEPWSQKSKGFRVAGWLKDDKAVLIYDEFDIWQVDPTGKLLPKNVTNFYGRKHGIVFRLARNIYSSDPLNDTLILVSFDRNTKENGFYKKSLLSNEKPKLLHKGNFLSFIPDEFLGQSIVRSKTGDVYLVQLQTVSQSPNYYWTTDFKNFNQISELHPEKNYNWMSSELVTYSTLDDKKNMGILYKPENFDVKNKYPLLIHYYSKRSHELNIYRVPGSENGELDISWFVSHGYLVFIPDIHYKIGEPGESALNSVVGAVKFLSKYSWVDSKHIGLQGHSLGGWETNYIVTHSNLFGAACSSSGMSDFVGNYLQLLGGHSNHDWYENRICRIGATLWEKSDLYIKNSPVFYLDNITTPLLTIANKGDVNVQFTQGLELFLALRRLGKRAWMLQYDGENHGVDGNARIDYIMRMTQFFDHYLKGALAPKWMTRGIPAKMKGIDDGFELDNEIKTPGDGLLTPEQKQKVEALQKRKPITITIN